MATHSSVLAWRIQGWGSLVGCRLWGCTESDMTEATQQQQQQQQQQQSCKMLELLIYRESMITTLPKQIFPSEEVLAGDSFTSGKQWCLSHGDDENLSPVSTVLYFTSGGMTAFYTLQELNMLSFEGFVKLILAL